MSRVNQIVLYIEGMSCGACTSRIEGVLGEKAGIFDVAVSLESSKASVRYDENIIAPAEIRDAVIAMGYRASFETGSG